MRVIRVRMFVEALPDDHEAGAESGGVSSGSMAQLIGRVAVYSDSSPRALLATLDAREAPDGVEFEELVLAEELVGMDLPRRMVELLAAALFKRGPLHVHWAYLDGVPVTELGFVPLAEERWYLDPIAHAQLVSRVLEWSASGSWLRRGERRLHVAVSARFLEDQEARTHLHSFSDVPGPDWTPPSS